MYDLVRKSWFDEESELKYTLQEYSNYEKKENEKAVDSFMAKLDKYFRGKPASKCHEEVWEEKGKKIFKDFLAEDKIFNLSYLDKKTQDAVMEMTKDFINTAKEFDEKISEMDIVQALRNIWIAAILQIILERKVRLTKSVFAYSMIYPYSDNFLDDRNICIEEKKKFNKKIYSMIEGRNINVITKLEDKIYTLIRYIEDEYKRGNFPGVYKSLIEIQEGQQASLRQMKRMYLPYENDVLGISIKKGGASVLADGYLIKGRLSLKEERFCIYYGALLQFVDDFQDLKSDRENNYSTVFSELSGKYYLDLVINKLINLVFDVFDGTELLRGKDNLNKVMKSNCVVLILCSIALNKEYFTDEYMNIMEKCMPFTIEYIEKLDKKLKKKMKKTEVLI